MKVMLYPLITLRIWYNRRHNKFQNKNNIYWRVMAYVYLRDYNLLLCNSTGSGVRSFTGHKIDTSCFSKFPVPLSISSTVQTSEGNSSDIEGGYIPWWPNFLGYKFISYYCNIWCFHAYRILQKKCVFWLSLYATSSMNDKLSWPIQEVNSKNLWDNY
jgi:hypothetical protein